MTRWNLQNSRLLIESKAELSLAKAQTVLGQGGQQKEKTYTRRGGNSNNLGGGKTYPELISWEWEAPYPFLLRRGTPGGGNHTTLKEKLSCGWVGGPR